MKQFFKMMFASALGVFVALALVIFISIFTMIAVIGSMSSSESVYVAKPQTVFKLSLNGSITDSESTENPFTSLLGDDNKSYSLMTLQESIRKAKEDKNIVGIYLEAGSLSTASANLEALRRSLIDFKESGKFIVAYGDNYTQGNYFLCSVADKMYMNPQGMVNIIGLASQNIFIKGLAEKVGLEYEVFKVGTYKGAVEPYILDKLSDANREQIESYIASTWKNLSNGMAESRGVSVADINHFANQGLVFADPSKAVECSLIDELMYKSQAEELVKELAGQTGKKLKTVGVDKIKNIKEAKKKKGEKIAILYAEGQIMESSSSPFNTESLITQKIGDELAKLKNDDDIKAVVFRVNSPGGSAFISEQIWHQVVELKKEKPVVVSMGSMAASGGYYISCAADKIVAEPTTLTGSIGIFGLFRKPVGTLKKVGVTTEVVKTNKFADFGDFSRTFNEDEQHILQGYIERGYDLFISRCAEGRGMTKEEIDAIGQGRVWTGEQALEHRLVDELGGIDKAIEIAAELAEIPDYQIVKVDGSKDFFSTLLEKQLEDIKFSILKSAWGEDMDYLNTLRIIRSTDGIQARLPYDMQPL
ncbi:protease-4 [Parabacteroides sp. PFB2-10]|uniref:signal peptide peptidase SppA n=1 Tax=Parabacteroides sp. PFB2-10 TaxID=1742405 RepID=UPI00247463B5|nr:signal peptide peptidase SppA [Parabacteroides sp. PFB2-10]MDH6311627.1 protease-4 [Parabacteroides sp. PFB2-10]MDL2244211.1 signal peptide peptidase SppA [Parabacteroides sp. OttesenSCG-928-J18]